MEAIAKSSGRYILNPSLDIWITGLASIVAIGIILLVNPDFGNLASFGEVLTLTTVVNGAHFMASYRMLYQSKEEVRRYPAPAIYMPLMLFTYSFVAILFADTLPVLADALLILTSLYLALHYTGQTWGMMSTTAFIDKVKFENWQRTGFKFSLQCLTIWQVIWSLSILNPKPYWLGSIASQSNSWISTASFSVMILAILIGSTCAVPLFIKGNYKSATRILVPYIALYFWYALLSVNPLALPLIQFFHAVQYLIFPVRVELNRDNRMNVPSQWKGPTYLGAMLGIGAVVFVLIPYYFKIIRPEFAGAIQIFISTINIHHFYIDGCVWKISHPAVREDLFDHLNRN